MPEFNKLVRDRIPEIIASSGIESVTSILAQKEYSEALRKKLEEEVSEFLEDGSVEELADVLEVVYALAKLADTSVAQLEGIRARKAKERGGFEARIFLHKTSNRKTT